MKRFVLCCVDPDGSLDSVICTKGKHVKWCNARHMPSTSFLDDMASFEMTHNEDVRDIERVFEQSRTGIKPDIPTLFVVFQSRRYTTLREWTALYKEGEEKSRTGVDTLKSWALRKKVSYILDSGSRIDISS